MKTWVWVPILVGVALILSPWQWPAPPSQSLRALAVVIDGPAPKELDAIGLLARLRDSKQAWLGANLLLTGRTNWDGTWRRIETGMLDPGILPNRFPDLGIRILGSRTSATNPTVDSAMLEKLEADGSADANDLPARVVVLGCTRGELGLRDPDCRAVVERAIDLLERVAGRGGTGLLLSVPATPASPIGGVWVAGPHLKESSQFRFRDIDLLPTLLYLADATIPVSLAGVPGYDVFSGDYMFHHPPRYSGG